MSSHIYINHAKYQDQTSVPPSSPPPNPQIRVFHASLPHYAPTPLISLPTLAQSLGVSYILIKDESSRLGLPAFKILGASWATYLALTKRLHLHVAPPNERSTLVHLDVVGSAAREEELVLYAATDGNHGRAVARMAGYLGIEASIYVPDMVDEETKGRIVGEGARVIVVEGDYDRAVRIARRDARREKGARGVLVSDTALEEEEDDLRDEVPGWIVEGYETMFGEVEEQVREITGQGRVNLVVTPVGVGSLGQAAVTHFKDALRAQKTAIVAVEPMAAACLKTSLEEGIMTSIKTGYTICTGMCCGTLSANAWPVLKAGVDLAITVEDEDVHEAIQLLHKYDVHAGPCGAACLAGLLRLVGSGVCALDKDAVIVLLCTEGERGYRMVA